MFYYIYVSESDLKKALQNFFPFKKEISCWAFLSYSCQNWGCGLFNLCTWSLLISWKICKMLFLSNLWENNLKKSQTFFEPLPKVLRHLQVLWKKKLGKKGWRWWRTECLKWRGSVIKNFNLNKIWKMCSKKWKNNIMKLNFGKILLTFYREI